MLKSIEDVDDLFELANPSQIKSFLNRFPQLLDDLERARDAITSFYEKEDLKLEHKILNYKKLPIENENSNFEYLEISWFLDICKDQSSGYNHGEFFEDHWINISKRITYIMRFH